MKRKGNFLIAKMHGSKVVIDLDEGDRINNRIKKAEAKRNELNRKIARDERALLEFRREVKRMSPRGLTE